MHILEVLANTVPYNSCIILPDTTELTPFYQRVKGLYRKHLEENIARRVKDKDNGWINICTITFGYDQRNDRYNIIWRHDREKYHDPKPEDILMYFNEFIFDNPLIECTYCGDAISGKTANSFCGKNICPKCEEIANRVSIERRMYKDMDAWEND